MPSKKSLNSKGAFSSSKKRLGSQMDLQNQKNLNSKPRKVVKKENGVSNDSNMINEEMEQNFYEKIQEIPTYQLTKTDMQGDPVELLAKLEQKYRQFGAVKMVASDTWNCPFTFKYVDKEITTRIQCLQKLKEGKPFQQKVRAYRIANYEQNALEFSYRYKNRTNPTGKTEQGRRQQEYWNLVTKPEYENKPVTVEYAADLSTSVFGSGFPTKQINNWKDTDFKYQSNYFNLNNISKSPTSLLSIYEKRKQKISGISYPWLYMGMMFSTFCWHVEDSFVNSLNYNHKGATKTWYIVPGRFKQKFDKFVQDNYEKSQKKKNLLDKIVLMIDPKDLVKQGIQAYHGGFSHGFNVGQAVNFVSVRSIPYMEEAERFYLDIQKRKQAKPKPLVLCKQWILHENKMQDKFSQLAKKDQLEIKLQYEKMILQEYLYLKDQLIVKGKYEKMTPKDVTVFSQEYKYQKLSCQYCKNYIYLSAISCSKCGILCKNHINRCECSSKQAQFQLILREPNNDRKGTFEKYPVILKEINKFQDPNSNSSQSLKKGNSKPQKIKPSIKRSKEKKQQSLDIIKRSKLIRQSNRSRSQ